MKNLFLLLILTLTFHVNAQEKDKPFFSGLKDDNITFRKTVKSRLAPGRHIFPSKVSLKSFAPPVQQQGSMGTCVGWSFAYCAASICNTVTSGENTPFSPYCLYNRIKDSTDEYCDYGLYPWDAVDLINTKGLRPWKNHYNKCLKDYSYNIYNNSFEFVSLNISVNDFKKSISEYHPIAFGMEIYADSTNSWNYSISNSHINDEGLWTFEKSDLYSRYGGRHAMCIIGYDDDKFGGAFMIQNSWGNDWGHDGYFWIRYKDIIPYNPDTNNGYFLSAYSAQSSVNYNKENTNVIWDFGPFKPEDYPDSRDENYFAFLDAVDFQFSNIDSVYVDALVNQEDDFDWDEFWDDFDYDDSTETSEEFFTVINNTDNYLFVAIAYETYDGWNSIGWWPCSEHELTDIDISDRISDEIYYRIEDELEENVWSGDASRIFCTSEFEFNFPENVSSCSRKREFGLFAEGEGTLSIDMNSIASRDLGASKYSVSKINMNRGRNPILNNLFWDGGFSLIDPVNNTPIISAVDENQEYSIWIVNDKNIAKEFIGSADEIKKIKKLKFSSEKTANIHIAFSNQVKK